MVKNALVKSGLFLFVGLFLGRILGLLREMALALNFGVSPEADIIIALITLPDIIINIFIGNAAAAVFIPLIQNQSHSTKLKFFFKLSGIFFALFSAVCLLLVFKIDLLGKAILPAQANADIFLNQLRWTLIAIPFLALNSISRLFLQSENKFFLIGMENVIFNAAVILAIFLTKDVGSLYFITIAIIFGSVFRWLVQVIKIFNFYQTSDPSAPVDLQLKGTDFYLFAQALSASLIVQLVPILGRTLSSYFVGDGGLSIFNYVYKFSEFAIVISISIGSAVLFPKLSTLFGSDQSLFNGFVKRTQLKLAAVFLPLTLVLPAALIFLAPYLEKISYLQKMKIETFVQYLALCLAFISVRAFNEFYIIVFNAKRDITTPLKSTSVAALVGLVSIYFFTKSFGILGAFIGINLFYSVNLALNFLFLFVFPKPANPVSIT